MAKKGKKILEKRSVRSEEDEEIDNEEIDGNEGVDDSDVPKSAKVIKEQQEEDVIEKDEDDIYDESKREEQLEEDEISPEEAGFVEGYEDTEVVECKKCGNTFDFDKAVERVINGKTYQFCDKKCAESFDKRKAGLR